ncbi:hypothetical protein JIN85_13515 [Luteolibacter pohnpeiensis]|uniref:Uncharacterized protein n=1 Tax=Luteolibacter pohnpeiensis TaxID=454153 RepID=A0A934S8Z0_9BACT|nr:hypothetical protein [Luteolibacter pohnpeiensis]MBK1883439.1 hypothetical protein [Luteolibacter pohnpeiensis]
MKSILSALILVLSVSHVRAGEVVLPYSAFGPQVVAYELIGMEWWQWDSQGDAHDHKYPIKVVVYWDQTQEETAKRHPVDQSKLQDFRYVEYSKAVEHLEASIKDFAVEKLDASAMEKALAILKKRKADEGSDRQATTRSKSDSEGDDELQPESDVHSR